MTTQLVFVVGNARSGTTLLAHCLGQHERVFTCSELHFFEDMWDPDTLGAWSQEDCLIAAAELLARHNQGYLSPARTPAAFRNAAKRAINQLTFPAKPDALFSAVLDAIGKGQGTDIVVEQTPQNALFSTVILERFPSAKIIHIVRDPRDVLASQKQKWHLRWRGVSALPWRETIRVFFNYSPVLMTRMWCNTLATVLPLRGAENFLLVRYETLANEPAATLKNICKFLDISFSPNMLFARQEASSHFGDVDDPVGIHPGSVGKWKSCLSNGEVKICERQAGDLMGRFGYAAAEERTNDSVFWPLWYLVLVPQIFIILALNIGRYRSLVRSIRRRFFPVPKTANTPPLRTG